MKQWIKRILGLGLLLTALFSVACVALLSLTVYGCFKLYEYEFPPPNAVRSAQEFLVAMESEPEPVPTPSLTPVSAPPATIQVPVISLPAIVPVPPQEHHGSTIVKSYYKKDGTLVHAHERAAPRKKKSD